MVDTADLKSSVLTDVWVRVPPSVPDVQPALLSSFGKAYLPLNRRSNGQFSLLREGLSGCTLELTIKSFDRAQR